MPRNATLLCHVAYPAPGHACALWRCFRGRKKWAYSWSAAGHAAFRMPCGHKFKWPSGEEILTKE